MAVMEEEAHLDIHTVIEKEVILLIEIKDIEEKNLLLHIPEVNLENIEKITIENMKITKLNTKPNTELNIEAVIEAIIEEIIKIVKMTILVLDIKVEREMIER